MLEVLRTAAYTSRKGDISINKVGAIILGLAVVALVYMAVSNWLGDIGGNFVDNVEYPDPS